MLRVLILVLLLIRFDSIRFDSDEEFVSFLLIRFQCLYQLDLNDTTQEYPGRFDFQRRLSHARTAKISSPYRCRIEKICDGLMDRMCVLQSMRLVPISCFWLACVRSSDPRLPTSNSLASYIIMEARVPIPCSNFHCDTVSVRIASRPVPFSVYSGSVRASYFTCKSPVRCR